MSEAKQKIIKVSELVKLKNLTIPTYQRPYSWSKKNIKQLLDDLIFAMNKTQQEYRLGNLIIHNDINSNDLLNIVDGQQRLTTLSIVLYLLNHKDNKLLECFYDSELSIEIILRNMDFIDELLKSKDEKFKTNLKNYILDNCEFVYIELYDLSEAFQLFDSQNARGKALEAYDLLKAFHLREMEEDSQEDKLNCVVKWESYVDNGKINQILGANLYRIRKWSKGESGEFFSKDNIEEFKGVNIKKHKNYPYLKPYLMNIGLKEDIENNKLLKIINYQIEFPFQINQMIINGKYFFKYVFFYSQLFDELFEKSNSDFLDFYNNHTAYEGSWRQGDIYVKELFQAIILLYQDKFGENDFKQAYKYLYKWAYKLRLEKSSVRYHSIDKYIKDNYSLFKRIQGSYYTHQVFKDSIVKPEIKRSIDKVEQVFN
ncbi:MAG: DUF262 domain-containing protein [Candidatus Methylacidiphilales bacterium]